ncbi:MAG TPA: hypothetical protein PKD86_15285 [Gemmatales bacterium]|nr:hypothetical protein [Gemmatales bacterium]HMP60707.1 hypothetical protein [Gemmatales bacterium]
MNRRDVLKTLAALPLSASLRPLLADVPPPRDEYAEVVRRTAAMVHDPKVQRLAEQHGLQVLNLTWEDTGRFKGSAVGPNISDMTIQVQTEGGKRLTCMPVIRFPNFTDKTGDVAFDQFFLPVGNETGRPLVQTSLRTYLGSLRAFLSKPESWKGYGTSLLANRDSHVLVSAQACFLPVPKQGVAEFNPVLFNYQSMKGDPAVLAILVTREGSSTTIIDNVRDGFQTNGVWGQRLFFNRHGMRASLTGTRKSDFEASGSVRPPEQGGSVAGMQGMNMVLMIQVPLKQKNPPRPMVDALPGMAGAEGAYALRKNQAQSDVEEAVIGSGKVEGPFTEIDNLEIERDDRFPVRVTVQFYQATSNGVVSPEDMSRFASQINQVYAKADAVGSLVTQGDTGRVTEYTGPKSEPPGWWAEFWRRYEQNTGRSRRAAIEELRKLRGDWQLLTEDALAKDALTLPGVRPFELPPARKFESFK